MGTGDGTINNLENGDHSVQSTAGGTILRARSGPSFSGTQTPPTFSAFGGVSTPVAMGNARSTQERMQTCRSRCPCGLAVKRGFFPFLRIVFHGSRGNTELRQTAVMWWVGLTPYRTLLGGGVFVPSYSRMVAGRRQNDSKNASPRLPTLNKNKIAVPSLVTDDTFFYRLLRIVEHSHTSPSPLLRALN